MSATLVRELAFASSVLRRGWVRNWRGMLADVYADESTPMWQV